jgi:2-polyprenyl-3-methyl-5-hydroxy-6-metoxy-1,4-benzoquinol methylase
MKPRILMLIDRPDWAYDACAQGLAKQLDDLYEFEFAYVREKPHIDLDRYDLIYVYFWGETYLNQFNPNPDRVIKEISSHRWAFEKLYGRCSPAEMVDTYLGDAGTRIATSQRLFDLLSPHAERIFHCPNGYQEEYFENRRSRVGALSIGWAGNPHDEAKRFSEIIEPLKATGFAIQVAAGDLPHKDLVDFYNDLDVICIASRSEGTPLPLLEAMASGCYPVCTDVGVVSEIVEHQKNGLIVDGERVAFENALGWCERNLEQIRGIGVRNSERIPQIRSWGAVANRFHTVFQDALAWAHVPEGDSDIALRVREGSDLQQQSTAATPSELEAALALRYGVHYRRLNPNTDGCAAYHANCLNLREDVIPHLPADQQTHFLEIGIGDGYFIQYLCDQRYVDVIGIDNCPELIENAAIRIGERAELICVTDSASYLEERPASFDCICMIDVFEHFSFDEGFRILRAARSALRADGQIILRTPNMANLLGAYSRWIDLTHKSAYTEWSLQEMLEVAGFTDVQIRQSRDFVSRKRALMHLVNRVIHRFMYWLNDRKMPKTLSKNLVATAKRGSSFLKPS